MQNGIVAIWRDFLLCSKIAKSLPHQYFYKVLFYFSILDAHFNNASEAFYKACFFKSINFQRKKWDNLLPTGKIKLVTIFYFIIDTFCQKEALFLMQISRFGKYSTEFIWYSSRNHNYNPVLKILITFLELM